MNTAVSPPPRVFHKLVEVWRADAESIAKQTNGVFRGITNSMPGFWTVVGVTRNALAVMEEGGFKGNFAKNLRRDHIKSAREFQQVLMDRPVTYAEFCELVADYGRCVICTKDENPARGAGYGTTYTDADILWIEAPFCTSLSRAVPTDKRALAAYTTAKGK